MHHTKEKGDLAVAKVIADLTVKGYKVYLPISEHTKTDLIAENGKLYRIQVKYSTKGLLHNYTSWADKNGSHRTEYSDNDFDFYGLYLPDIDKVVYPSIKYKGCSIRTTIPETNCKYHWYEDFLEIKDEDQNQKPLEEFSKAKKCKKRKKINIDYNYVVENLKTKTIKEISESINVSQATLQVFIKKNNIQLRSHEKINWPIKEELEKLVWEIPSQILAKQLGVSDKAIEKRCKKYGISKPPRGYWAKLASKACIECNVDTY